MSTLGSGSDKTDWIRGLEQAIPDGSNSDSDLCDLDDGGCESPGRTISYQSSYELFPSLCNCLDRENDYHRKKCEQSDSNDADSYVHLTDHFTNTVCVEILL